MKALALALIFSAALPAAASTLTYELDLSQTPEMDIGTVTEMCGVPTTITMNAKDDLATVVVNKTQTSDPKSLKIETIQKNGAAMTGGGLGEPYKGDYRTRVMILNNKSPNSVYKLGVVTRVEITTFGNPSAPKAFIVNSELLNYRESAELAEDMACAKLAYKLK